MATNNSRKMAELANTDTTATTAWIPRDVYAKAVFMALHAKRILGNLTAAVAHDIGQGEGATIKVRFYPKRSAQGPISEGSALTANADTPTTKSITILKYGDYSTLTDEAIQFTSDDVRGRLLAEMGAAMAQALELVVVGLIAGRVVTDAGTTNTSTTVTSASAAFTSADVGRKVSGTNIPASTTISSVTNATTIVISNAATGTNAAGTLVIAPDVSGASTQNTATNGVVDYNTVLKAQAVLKALFMHPDFLVLSPDHEVDLLLDSNVTKFVDYAPGEVSFAGEVGKIGAIKIIVHPLFPAKSTVSGATQGVLLDSSRAWGEAFGKPLRFEEFRVIEQDIYKEVCWAWYGAGVLDATAICLIKNA